MIYEFITPSDPITFSAENDKVACICAVLLGNGKAGCTREDGESIPSMWLFHHDPIPEIEKYLETSMESFMDNNKAAIINCFKSFAYGSIEDRKSYDDAIAAITDEIKLNDFKKKHEDRNRSSMSQWVKQAWAYGESMAEKQTA